MATNTSAPASCGPTREIVLLVAEARPARLDDTDVSSADGSGATMIDSPHPNRSIAGRKSTMYPDGGIHVAGASGRRPHGALSAGTRASHRSPAAMIAGPIAMNRRKPTRA